MALFSEEPSLTPTDDDKVTENIQPNGTLETFIMDEQVHLISIIRALMEKTVPKLFEQYSDQLVPEILEAVIEKSKCVAENRAEKKAMGGNDKRYENADTDDLMVLVFQFICPMCGKQIRSTQQPTKNSESSYFSLSNVQRHWNIHAQENKPKKPKKAKNSLSKPEVRRW